MLCGASLPLSRDAEVTAMASARYVSLGFALLSLPFSSATADTISTWNGGSGNWSTAGQWTPSVVPTNTASQSYAVTIGSGTVTLDTSPTINSLTLNGVLTTGFDISNGQYTSLTVSRNVTVNGGISGGDGIFDSIAIGGNLTNAGGMAMGSSLSVGGSLQNSGYLKLSGVESSNGYPPLFSVGGTLVNTGIVQWGDNDVDAGTRSILGELLNKGSVFLSPGTVVSAPVSDAPKGSSWVIAGTLNGFSPASLDGTVLMEDSNNIGIGSIGKSGSLTLDSSLAGPMTVNVSGFSNSGTVLIGAEGNGRPDLGSSTLNIAGAFTNQASGTLTVNNPPNPQLYPHSPGSLIGQNIANYGTINFQAGTTSTAQQLVNSGTVNIYGDEAGDLGQLTVGTLKTAGGLTEVWNNGGALLVGSGTLPSGFAGGYYQFANGIWDEAGGALEVEGPAHLDGTLDVMLEDGYKPVGTVFTLLYGGEGSPVTGVFSDVQGLVFDGGRERWLIDYGAPYGTVTLTVQNNATPEPRSLILTSLGLAGILGLGFVRQHHSS